MDFISLVAALVALLGILAVVASIVVASARRRNEARPQVVSSWRDADGWDYDDL